MRTIAVFGFATLALCAACMAAEPAFEVISVKLSPPQGGPMGAGIYTYPGGRLRAASYPVVMLIHDAYDLPEYRILGGPRWIHETCYDIEAKPPASSPSSHWIPESFKSPPNPEMREMLKALLRDRFQLQVHRETRKESVYVLVVTKGGHKLHEPASRTVQPFISYMPHGLRGQNATMDQLAERLAGFVGRPVSNRTGIAGNFDFTISYPEAPNGVEFTAGLLSILPVETGLKLETEPGSVDVLVVDRAEKPSAN